MFLNHRHLQLLLLILLPIFIPCVKPIVLPNDPGLMELNYPINENTLHWITARSFQKSHNGGFRNGKSKNGTMSKYWYQTEDVAYNSHTGTHLDAPCHFAQYAWCVNDIPMEHLMERPIYGMDVRFSYEDYKNSDYQISVEQFRDNFNNEIFHSERDEFKDGSVLMIITGWNRKWPIKEDYFGIRKGDEGRMHFPGISPELADHIVSFGKFVGVGIDGPSIDPGLSTDKYAHRKFAENNIYVIENLPNFAGITVFGTSRVTIAPLNVEGASGSPVRVFVRNHNFPPDGKCGSPVLGHNYNNKNNNSHNSNEINCSSSISTSCATSVLLLCLLMSFIHHLRAPH